ncbi:MAG: glycosyl hydrolase 53 family protein [Phycisphaerae bacterium]|jgi:arabinogalactan endo-1,4-beta-galactosidase
MYRKIIYSAIAVLLLMCVVMPNKAYAFRGVDISILTRQEADGVKYNDDGVQKDLLTILKNHGIDLVRIRLFVNPDTNDAGVAMNLDYVKALTERCKAAGMKIMLDIHYSDTWANPGVQTKPAAWAGLTKEQLVAKVYDYTKDVCSQIKPDYTQIGNETNCGMLWPEGNACDGNWATLRELITSAHKGIKDGGGGLSIIHVAENKAADLKWFFDNLLASSVSFDVIGLSYYPEHHGNINNFRVIHEQAKSYKKEIVICELGDYYRGNSATEDTQAKYIADVLAINSNVVYWEPAWIFSSPVGNRALFKPIDGNWKNVEMTKGLVILGGGTRP